jgi:hypothetical protein
VVKAPAGRRDAFVDRYFRRAAPDQVVVILKGREPARILIALGTDDRWHLQYDRRWVDQYNFYLLDREWGRLFAASAPTFPSPRACASISITGSRIACTPRALLFGNMGMPF